MKNGLTNDASLLCETIFSNCIPNSNWMFINIAKNILDSNRTFNLNYFPLIKTTYAYFIDDVPQLLITEGVIEKFINGRWITGLENIKNTYENALTVYARSKGIIKNNESVGIFYDSSNINSFGPKYYGQYAALINIDALKTFYFKYNPPTISSSGSDSLPIFDNSKGVFIFIGKSITIKANLKKKLLDLLVKNINRIVSDEELYDIRGVGKYKSKTANKTLEPANDANEKLVKELKEELYSIPEFKKTLFFVNHFGSGLFVDKRFVTSDISPQQNPQN